MNWGEGFFRLWVACSIAWVALIALLSTTLFENFLNRGVNLHRVNQDEATVVSLVTVASIMLLPPIVLYVVGRVIGWITKGFRQ